MKLKINSIISSQLAQGIYTPKWSHVKHQKVLNHPTNVLSCRGSKMEIKAKIEGTYKLL